MGLLDNLTEHGQIVLTASGSMRSVILDQIQLFMQSLFLNVEHRCLVCTHDQQFIRQTEGWRCFVSIKEAGDPLSNFRIVPSTQ